MSLIRLQNIRLAYGAEPLLDGIDLTIDEGERVCLVGRNGEGKSTLLKVIAGQVAADEGEVRRRQGLRVAFVPQEVPTTLQGRVFDLVADGLGELAERVKAYHRACLAVAEGGDEGAMARLTQAQQALEAVGGWAVEQRVATVLSRMALPADAPFETLSGGMKRRVLLARALVSEPHLLLLDEPTNHLDMDAILWLEKFLLGWSGSLLFITHDRAFLRRLATRILELDRGRLTDWPGDYDNYLRRRAERDNAEALEQARFDKKLAQEEIWIRQGIKARRTRNEGRVRQLEQMREAARRRRARQGRVKLTLEAGERPGKRVCEAEGITYRWQGRPLVQDFSTTLLRGDRVGIVGPNGCGKSTLLKLLLGELAPQAGRVRLGSRLQVAYFDQMRAQLDEQATVIDNVAGGREQITLGGRSRHVMGYLQDFLFPPARARQPVAALSGGERNRLLLAKLFAQPANLLVLDEPTNDLDVETLELLEERLLAFDGTLLLVSHDRAFLDNVVTRLLVFEGDGRIGEYVGSYSDWLASRPQTIEPSKPKPKAKETPPPTARRSERIKLSWRESQELARLPTLLEEKEEAKAELEARLADPELYRNDDGEAVRRLTGELDALKAELEALYERWEQLEAKQAQAQGGR